MNYYVGQNAVFSKTISESDIYNFAGICGDFNPVHVNAVAAGKSIFEKRIAHGLLGASLISTVLGMYLPGPGTIYLSQSLEFSSPVYIGDTLSAKVTITQITEKGRATLDTIVLNQNGKEVITGKATVKLPKH